MKLVLLALSLCIAFAAFADEKKVDRRAFRMPPKKGAPEKKANEPLKSEATAGETKEGEPLPGTAAGEAPESEAVAPEPHAPEPHAAEQPETKAGTPAVAESGKGEKPATSPTAFRLPDAAPSASPEVAPEPEPAPEPAPVPPAKSEIRKAPKGAARAFTLPGEKPAPAKKKNPVTFRMPEKKPE